MYKARNLIKKYLKNNRILFNIVAKIILTYLKFTYATSKWHFVWPEGFSEQKINDENGLFFALWHNRLVYSINFFRRYTKVCALVSPHADGKIIAKIALMFGKEVIEGSTNKNARTAVKQIIQKLTDGAKIVITPDGPRGPVYKNSSVITKIASKYNKKIIPISFHSSKYFKLKSWDGMFIPRPFSKIWVVIGEPLKLTGNELEDRLLLEEKLNSLTKKSESLMI